MSRPTWDETYMTVAHTLALRSSCKRGKVGAVATRDNRLLLCGYNGAPPGMPHCEDVGCDIWHEFKAPGPPDSYLSESVVVNTIKHCKRSIHAEQNVVGLAARWGISLEGATWYIYPWGPCVNCELLLIATQPKAVIFPDSDSTSGGTGQRLVEAGIDVFRVDTNDETLRRLRSQ